MSIQFTEAVILAVFPTSSWISNTNSPFSVNVWLFEPSLFVTVMVSLSFTRVAVTSLLVGPVISYFTSADGAFLSIQSTEAVIVFCSLPIFRYVKV